MAHNQVVIMMVMMVDHGGSRMVLIDNISCIITNIEWPLVLQESATAVHAFGHRFFERNGDERW